MKPCIGQWRERGDCVLGWGCREPASAQEALRDYRVDHDYELFGELGRKIPA